MNGILNINKPRDMTSFAVVAKVRRICGEKHAGHAGTLDPLATGVLPVCLGQSTRVIEFLFDETKTYRAEIELGKSTDTYDVSGQVTRTSDYSGISREMIESSLEAFRGTILQTPPMYSALKYKGKPLYKLAREGLEIERKSRPVSVFAIDIVEFQLPLLTLDITCGKGTYIRCIAHDLGESLGCGALMKNLVRLQVGPFRLEEALTLEQLEKLFLEGRGPEVLYPVDHVLMGFEALIIDQKQGCSLIHGSPITINNDNQTRISLEKNTLSRVYTDEGNFIGMVRYDPENKHWKPEKIFANNCCAVQPS